MYYTIQAANNKGEDQTVQMHSLVFTFVVCIPQNRYIILYGVVDIYIYIKSRSIQHNLVAGNYLNMKKIMQIIRHGVQKK